VRDTLERRLREVAEGLAATYGCTARVDYQRRYPPLVNHPEQTDIAIGVASKIVGGDKVAGSIPPITGAEDFSFMLQQRPGAFIMIGNGVKPDGSYHYVHTPHYDFNDEILALGATYWVGLVGHELGVEG
jgi:metal-dependent amidase/aminoacylase/carboxypeptidase family protein